MSTPARRLPLPIALCNNRHPAFAVQHPSRVERTPEGERMCWCGAPVLSFFSAEGAAEWWSKNATQPLQRFAGWNDLRRTIAADSPSAFDMAIPQGPRGNAAIGLRAEIEAWNGGEWP